MGHFQEFASLQDRGFAPGLGFCSRIGVLCEHPTSGDQPTRTGQREKHHNPQGQRWNSSSCCARSLSPFGYKRREWLGVDTGQRNTHRSLLSAQPEPPRSRQAAGHHVESSSFLRRAGRLLGTPLKGTVPTFCQSFSSPWHGTHRTTLQPTPTKEKLSGTYCSSPSPDSTHGLPAPPASVPCAEGRSSPKGHCWGCPPCPAQPPSSRLSPWHH